MMAEIKEETLSKEMKEESLKDKEEFKMPRYVNKDGDAEMKMETNALPERRIDRRNSEKDVSIGDIEIDI